MLPCVWFSNRSQKTSKCGKNISDTLGYALCATFLFLPHFDVICDLLLNRRTATWNLFVKYTTLNHIRFVNFPSFLLALVTHSCIEIRYGGQQIVFSVREFLPPQQDLFKKTVSSIAFLNCPWVFYMFSEKIGPANLYLLSPSSLVQFSPDKHHLDISWLVKQWK